MHHYRLLNLNLTQIWYSHAQIMVNTHKYLGISVVQPLSVVNFKISGMKLTTGFRELKSNFAVMFHDLQQCSVSM